LEPCGSTVRPILRFLKLHSILRRLPVLLAYLCHFEFDRKQFSFLFRISDLNDFASFTSTPIKGVCMTANLIPSVDPLMDTESLQEIVSLPRSVCFGPFQIDRQRKQVYRGGSKLLLQGKVYQVLLVLIHNRGEVVTRERLKHAFWPADTHV